jgi:hypothetical protein
MKREKRVRLGFPYKAALSRNPWYNFMLTMGHMFIGLNSTTFFLGTIPIVGILMALALFSIVSSRKNIFYEDVVRFSFRRLILAFILIAIVYLLSMGVGIPIQKLWVMLIFIQLPLSLNDAYHVYHGKIGVTVFK